MAQIEIRYAKRDDYGIILDFLRKNYPEDYVLNEVKKWLDDNKGQIILAFEDNNLVGFSHVFIQNENVAWFEAARVKQNMKGRGIGTALNLEGIKYCKNKGINKARLVTSSKNVIAQKHLVKTPFRPYVRWIEWSLDSMDLNKEDIEIQKLNHEEIYNFLNERSCFEESGKLYQDSYIWYDLNLAWLKEKCELNRVYFDNENLIIADYMSRYNQYFQTCYVDIHEQNANKLLKFLKSLLIKLKPNFERTIIFSHKCSATIKALLSSGLKIVDEYIIYEAIIQ
jgi:Acetyltransferase (GNAT) family.